MDDYEELLDILKNRSNRLFRGRITPLDFYFDSMNAAEVISFITTSGRLYDFPFLLKFLEINGIGLPGRIKLLLEEGDSYTIYKDMLSYTSALELYRLLIHCIHYCLAFFLETELLDDSIFRMTGCA